MSELCDATEVNIYWQLTGEIQWAIYLGRIDIMCNLVTMATFRPAPLKGHLDQLTRIYSYLQNYKKTDIKFNVNILDYSGFDVLEGSWGGTYHPCCEDITHDAPEPKGKAF